MKEEMLEEILKTINRFKKEVPQGDILLKDINSMNIEELLKILNELFKREEEAVKNKRSNLYVTDDYENNIKSFATNLIKEMLLYHNELKDYDSYIELLGQRHIAYGFYNVFNDISNYDLNNIEYIKNCNIIIKDIKLKKQLYLGLVEFYQNFYGKFNDNEKAIELLCEFYPKDIDLHSNVKDIASAIYKHITNAGTSRDLGFAYSGIELIKKYIGNLPIGIIDELLKKYQLYKIINEKVYRHQIFTIIDNSILDSNDKIKYKFSYLDSVIIANNMNRNLYNKYWENESNFAPLYNSFEIDMSVENIVLIKDNIKKSNYAYWTNSCSIKRYFIVDNKIFINITLNTDTNEIWVDYAEKLMRVKFEFNYSNWMLSYYESKEVEQELYDFIFEIDDRKDNIIYNNLTFSLSYLNNYRGVKEQLVDIDHKFNYDKAENKLVKSSITSSYIPSFYGNKVYSLSCIVGKNGTGKTSTIDFLREIFFKLIRLIGEYGISCENGYIKESDYEKYGLMEAGDEFLVVFHLGNQPYYITNIKAVISEIAKPFTVSSYKSINELSKVVYFSNMLSVNQDNLYTDESKISTDDSSEKDLIKSLSSFRQVDYSEATSFIQRRKVIEINKNYNYTSVVNKDLCYQLAFLANVTREELKDFLDIPVDKKIILKSNLLSTEDVLITESTSLSSIVDGGNQKLKSFLTSPDSKIEYFSSGQYAKFSFLSKLYWFLQGYQKYISYFEKILEFKNVFSFEESLLEGETALIFIDEGELYYHPEWQRRYIKTLIDRINSCNIESKLQVVITTNSPFIISDILNEDITYLTSDKKEFDNTFAQNIHQLLRGNFFMGYTIGEYSREIIEKIMKWMYHEEYNIDVGKELSFYFGEEIEVNEYYEKIKCIIDKIGEPIYREELLDMLSKSKFYKESKFYIDYERNVLLRKISEMEQRLKELEGEGKL